MDFTKQSPAILSLCTGGVRGIERGFERACSLLNWQQPQYTTYVEIEAFIAWNLVKQMEQGILAPTPIFTNLKTFNAAPFRGKVDGIFAGYPCQPFSYAGNQKGTTDPRHLWPYIQRIIKTINPIFCFFENVPGHITLGFDEVYRSLSDMGYTVEAGIYSASEVGAPHQRERFFILAIKQELANGNSSRYLYQQSQKLPTKRWKYAQCKPCASNTNELANTHSNPLQRWKEQRWLRTKLGRDGEKLDNTNGNRQQPNNTICTRWYCIKYASKMGNPKSGRARESRNSPSKRKGFGITGASGNPCQKCLAYSIGSRQQQPMWRKSNQPAYATSKCDSQSWPSSPGQPQHQWEQPRTKPRLGFTINGYNFREDLLRMAGNGVVHQTATNAFLDLFIHKYSVITDIQK